tara:strand:- start:326 stop:1213 length:888 start_codon:yes stop_codon:yes gene_type:complete
MSHARQVFGGSTVAIALCCSEGRFFLRPGGRVNRLIRYLLARYAEEHGIRLHAFVFMGNHFHLILTDTRGLLPRFMGEFDSMLSRVLNRHWGRSGRLWESTPYRSWRLKSAEDLLQHLVYLAANPVAAWVVREPGDWPGVISLPSDVGTKRRVTPPAGGLFGRGHEGSALPAEASLEVHLPSYFEQEGLERYRRLFQRALDAYLEDLHLREGAYSGRDSAKRLDPFSAPKSAQGGPSFGLIPSLSNATKEDREDLTVWRHSVRAAFYRWQVDKTTRFPQGTWKVVKCYGARLVPG